MFPQLILPPLRRDAGGPMAADNLLTPLCSRCLSSGHCRVNCHCPIKCCACRNWGHVAASCPSSEKFEQRQDPGRSNGKAALVLNPNWFNLERNATNRPSSSSPPSFNSFGEMSRACFASWATREIAPALTIPWRLKPTHAEEDPTTNSKELLTALDPASWKLHMALCSCCTPCAAIVERENPPPVLQCDLHTALQLPPATENMANSLCSSRAAA